MRQEHFIQETSQSNCFYIDNILLSSGGGGRLLMFSYKCNVSPFDYVFMFCYLPVVNTSHVQTPHFMYFHFVLLWSLEFY